MVVGVVVVEALAEALPQVSHRYAALHRDARVTASAAMSCGA